MSILSGSWIDTADAANIVNAYFESLTKSVTIPLEVLDEVLKEWYSTDKDSKLSQHYVQKFWQK